MERMLFCLALALVLGFMVAAGCTHARPKRPGPDFVWVAPHKGPGGVIIPGHWKYVGPPKPGRVWVPGHYGPGGKWVPGHWAR